jgi:hypothetical protein
MSAHDVDRVKQLLKQAIPPVETDAEPARDLWPTLLHRLDEHAADNAATRSRWVWLDWALLGGLAVIGASFPVAIPLLLYYL